MNILEELYYGKIDPSERGLGGIAGYRELAASVSRQAQDLTAGMSQEQKAAFEQYQALSRELQALAERDTFVCGFKLGGQIMAEVMGREGVGIFT